MARMQVTAVIAVIAALVLGTLLTACASPTEVGSGGEAEAGSRGAVVEVVEGVEYYPACGNELLVLGETTWYPFEPSDPGVLPSVAAAGLGGGLGGGMARAILPAVAAPGPGDDAGTVTVFEGGLAHFVSDSGDLSAWLTKDRIEYSWVC